MFLWKKDRDELKRIQGRLLEKVKKAPAAFAEGHTLGLTGKCPGVHLGPLEWMEGFLYGTLERMGEVPRLALRPDGKIAQIDEAFTPRTPFLPPENRET